MAVNEIQYAPGMRAIIRDEEWMVKRVEINTMGNEVLHCVGISPLIKDKEAIFLTDLENIEPVDPAKVKLVPDLSPKYRRSLLYIESQWRRRIPTDSELHIGDRAGIPCLSSLNLPRWR